MRIRLHGFRLPIGWLTQPMAPSAIRDWLVGVLWVIFIVGTSSAHLPSLPAPERYFWLPADLIVVLLLLPYHREFLSAMADNKLLMSWPILAILSVLWSLSPAITLYHGLQLLMTFMAALLFCMTVDRFRMLKIIFYALLWCQVLSLAAVLAMPSLGLAPGGEWKGVFSHKNVLGMSMALQILTCVCLFLHGWQRWLCGSVLVFAAGLLAMSHSGTALVALVVALSPVPLAMVYRVGGNWLRAALASGCILAAALIYLLVGLQFDPVGAALEGVGKDRTLTGRTILWDIGIAAFLERPLLGYGFKGYWESPETTVQYLRMVIGHELWFFHNNFIEVAVGFGVIGAVLFVAGLLAGTVKTIKDFIYNKEYTTLWSALYMFFVIFVCLGENPLFANHSQPQFLMVAAIAVRDSRERSRPRVVKLRYGRLGTGIPAPQRG